MSQGSPPSDPLEAGLQIAEAFDRAGIPYALGGALAYGIWAVPRATVDVDVNVFVEEGRLGEVCAALGSLGIEADAGRAAAASRQQGMYVTRFGPFRIDLFTPSIEFSWEALRTRVGRTVEGKPVWFLSAEAIAVFKLLFFRGKDIVDLERLVAVRGADLDVEYVRGHIVEMMGENDERVSRWDAIVAGQGAG